MGPGSLHPSGRLSRSLTDGREEETGSSEKALCLRNQRGTMKHSAGVLPPWKGFKTVSSTAKCPLGWGGHGWVQASQFENFWLTELIILDTYILDLIFYCMLHFFLLLSSISTPPPSHTHTAIPWVKPVRLSPQLPLPQLLREQQQSHMDQCPPSREHEHFLKKAMQHTKWHSDMEKKMSCCSDNYICASC